VTLRLATAVLSLAAFSVIASARTSGWAGDYYAHHLQYRSVIALEHAFRLGSFWHISFGRVRFLTATGVVTRTF